MKHPLHVVGVLALAGLLNIAHAVPVSFSFTGSVTDDPFGLTTFGAPISGSYTFDSAAVDASAGPSTGAYPSIGPSFGLTATVDGANFGLYGALTVITANNIGLGVDQYGAIATDGTLTLEVFFEDATQTALSDDALPLVPPAVAAFAFRQFRLFSPDAEFLGTIDTLVCSAGCNAGNGGGAVPQPGTVWCLVAALCAFVVRRARSAPAATRYE